MGPNYLALPALCERVGRVRPWLRLQRPVPGQPGCGRAGVMHAQLAVEHFEHIQQLAELVHELRRPRDHVGDDAHHTCVVLPQENAAVPQHVRIVFG